LPGFILAVGTVERRKNYRRLADAYRMLRQRSAAVPPLVVAGKEGWANEDTLRRLRAEPGVQLLGHVEDAVLLALYQHARLLAFPSLYEGFGLPLLDAFATGLPALISSTGALPEVAGGAALMVEAEQPEAIAAGLERLLSDEPLRRVLAERGRERAAEFSWQRAGAAVAGLLDTIAAREG
jgi:alpha-1,3-rhamnosyl/mannosyltransferase